VGKLPRLREMRQLPPGGGLCPPSGAHLPGAGVGFPIVRSDTSGAYVQPAVARTPPQLAPDGEPNPVIRFLSGRWRTQPGGAGGRADAEESDSATRNCEGTVRSERAGGPS